jgi:hypothetical protein
MNDITIPPEALEAAARAIHAQEYDAESYPFENEDVVQQRLLRTQARAAILAALNAWPGMHHYEPNAEPYYGKHIILPKEPGNDT